MIGKRFVLSFDNIRPSESFLRLIEKYPPGGIIIFERNFSDIDSLEKNIKTIKSAAPETLIMLDEEGGIKSRIRREHGFPNPPDPRKTAENATAGECWELYNILGVALKKLGIDMNLAPVVDIAPESHILGNRAFSDNAEICARYGSAVIRGLTDAGIRSCAKHFPGLGSAEIDPHIETAVARDDADFEIEHLLPFREAIAVGVPAIMTTHLIANNLDGSGKVATFSPAIIRLLRDKLGFDGVVLSDDLLMGGATRHGELEDIAVNALKAGHDLVLVCSEVPKIGEILESAERRLGETEQHKLSLMRIEALRRKT
ncbi:hypothetical protein DRQ36_03350 [bacterium]|nr:MAG: hypothetical protein DRQ36_03350 [bacterium]